MEELIIDGESYTVLFVYDHKKEPYWGMNTLSKVMCIYNVYTSDRETIDRFKHQAWLQYKKD